MDHTDRLPATASRVHDATDPRINQRLRERTEASLLALQGARPDRYAAHLRALDREWDIERVLQSNAAAIVLVSLLLAARVDRRFALLPAAVFFFLGQHALQGWCPPVPVLRRLGVRTVREIERERYAAKALRGDFDAIPASGSSSLGRRVRAVLAAIDA